MAEEVESLEELEDDGPKIGLSVYLLKADRIAAFEAEIKRGREVRPLAPPLNGEFIIFPAESKEPRWVNAVRTVLQDPSGFALMGQ